MYLEMGDTSSPSFRIASPAQSTATPRYPNHPIPSLALLAHGDRAVARGRRRAGRQDEEPSLQYHTTASPNQTFDCRGDRASPPSRPKTAAKCYSPPSSPRAVRSP